MYPPIEPLPVQRLPQQPLQSPTGARLVLCNRDAGYPNSAHPSSPGRGTWSDSIANTRTTAFLQASNTHYHLRADCDACGKYGDHIYPTWRWPAVVLTPDEYTLRVGTMDVAELREELEEYWGWGGVPGAADDEDCYQDMWVHAWAPDYPAVPCYKPTTDPYNLLWQRTTKHPARLDRAVFSRWVNRECIQWLEYFIEQDHTLGAVHAWFTAFIGVTRESLVDLAEAFREIARRHDPESEAFMEAVHRLKIRMSFDVCIEGYDEVVDGIPALPSDTTITTNKQGMHVISNCINNMFPRRIWDICANTVIPATWFCGPPCPLTGRREVGVLGVKPVSHAWVADCDLSFVVTEANQEMWPIPLPKGVLLEDIRGEMIRLGVRYAWLDVLCLRQRVQPILARGPVCPTGMEVVESGEVVEGDEVLERHEQRRLEEWKVDVPTIGAIYSNPDKEGLYGGGPTVIFMSGLGRPFRGEGWAGERHWLKRAWTVQEAPVLSRCLIAGLPVGPDYGWRNRDSSGGKWPWNLKV